MNTDRYIDIPEKSSSRDSISFNQMQSLGSHLAQRSHCWHFIVPSVNQWIRQLLFESLCQTKNWKVTSHHRIVSGRPTFRLIHEKIPPWKAVVSELFSNRHILPEIEQKAAHVLVLDAIDHYNQQSQMSITTDMPIETVVNGLRQRANSTFTSFQRFDGSFCQCQCSVKLCIISDNNLNIIFHARSLGSTIGAADTNGTCCTAKMPSKMFLDLQMAATQMNEIYEQSDDAYHQTQNHNSCNSYKCLFWNCLITTNASCLKWPKSTRNPNAAPLIIKRPNDMHCFKSAIATMAIFPNKWERFSIPKYQISCFINDYRPEHGAHVKHL